MDLGNHMSLLSNKSLACILLVVLSLHQFGPLKVFGNSSLRDTFGLPIGATPTQIVGMAGVVVGGMCLFQDD
jgi:hypothetical protein